MREMIEEMVDDMLDIEGQIKIGNLVFSRSQIVRELDPVAYRELMNNVSDALIEDLQDELAHLDPVEDFDEVEDIKERIELLERL